MQIAKFQSINKPENLRRHIVILGAGASVQAFPNGDSNGKKLPTMENIVEMLGLEAVLERGGIKNRRRNFEDIYSELYENDSGSPFLKEIEEIIYTYFDGLKLPECPTIYDHLLLSLRPKDVVATFNWDPFLFDAWNRIKGKVPVPQIIHLHGNVRLAYCSDHPAYGGHGMYCPECHRKLIPSRLLYPIKIKDYAKDNFIKTEWEVLKKYLHPDQAMTLTIFGYGAPATDKEAIDIMSIAWDKDKKFIERVEIIDIKDEEVLRKQWKPFIIRNYFDYPKDFYKSRIAEFPRRTCEMLLDATVYGIPGKPNPFTLDANFDELLSWLKPLVEAERVLKDLGKINMN